MLTELPSRNESYSMFFILRKWHYFCITYTLIIICVVKIHWNELFSTQYVVMNTFSSMLWWNNTFSAPIYVTRDETVNRGKWSWKVNLCVNLLTSYGWLSFLVKIMCGECFNCFRSGRVCINGKFWVDMLYPGNKFTKSGHLRSFYVCFYVFLWRRNFGYGLQKRSHFLF